jgi:hypothetical protein
MGIVSVLNTWTHMHRVIRLTQSVIQDNVWDPPGVKERE